MKCRLSDSGVKKLYGWSNTKTKTPYVKASGNGQEKIKVCTVETKKVLERLQVVKEAVFPE